MAAAAAAIVTRNNPTMKEARMKEMFEGKKRKKTRYKPNGKSTRLRGEIAQYLHL